MATLVLSAAGAAVGGSIGGSVAGVSASVIGRAVGATVGRLIDQNIDQNIAGGGSEVIETGQVDRFRLSSAGEGEAVNQLFGRLRLAGQVIWSSDFLEEVTVTTTGGAGGGGGGGGKGFSSSSSGRSTQPRTTTRSYSYSINLAVAVCEGEITRIGRVWADGEEVAPGDLNMRIYKGRQNQQPDPLMEAIEGTGQVPAYRGIAYVVFENLQLEPYGNRVPQFSFEVSRPEQKDEPDADLSPTYGLRAVALIPGTGEYSLATSPVYYENEFGRRWSANINTPWQEPDFRVSLDILDDELPNCEAVSLVVSWFGNDLRCGSCTIRPKVEERDFDGNMKWNVSGLTRSAAQEVPRVNDRPVYGGTPADDAVVQAIKALKSTGQNVLFYPFILMDQLAGNTRTNPYDPSGNQPPLPWRGRITLSRAPGVAGSPDGTSAARGEVDDFFGTVTASDFSTSNGRVTYSGPNEWSLSRFILHYAALCKAAGGVEAFCISTEMRGLTQIRAENNRFYAVERLRALTGQVRSLVGSSCKITYAADWSEYFGYQPDDGSGDRFFHLDPLWADDDIDFIGIDNYMPLSDWRDGDTHADAGAGTVYDLEYLRSNIMGGEGYDWFYASPDDEAAQIRTPIEDGAYGEPWVYRYKDLKNWWENPHHDRIGGVRATSPSPWVPRSKPFWFTEYGCSAIDKGTNQPNKFLDPKSSESRVPKYSSGARDDLIQTQYIKAMLSFWGDETNNPVSPLYNGSMVDMSRAYIWAWDARPYPYFPNNEKLWSDAENYSRGHWMNGRTSTRALSSVVAEICERAGLKDYDTSKLYGAVRGYMINTVSEARASLQPLMLRYAFDAVERDGKLVFLMRNARDPIALDPDRLALSTEMDATIEQTRKAEAEVSGRVRLRFMQADANFDALAEEAVLEDEKTHAVATSEFPLALTRVEGRQTVERWLSEARVARDTIRFALPPSKLSLGAGDVVSIPGEQQEGRALYRIDRVEQGPLQLAEAVRVDPLVYEPSDMLDEVSRPSRFVPPVPVLPLFLDLPLISGDEVPHAPYLAASAQPWPGSVAVYQSPSDSDYSLLSVIGARSIIGQTATILPRAGAGRFDNGAPLRVKLLTGTLSSVEDEVLLAGANLAAIGDGTPNGWELFQFGRAELVETDTYDLSRRLRGQLGTDGLQPDIWPENSWFVLMNGLPQQIDLARNLRGVSHSYRIGPARRPVDDPSFSETSEVFSGNGLRPYTPVHLSATRNGSGGFDIRWIRRTRVDGDGWDTPEVPLGEEQESYLLRIVKNGTILREIIVDSPVWIYPLSEQAADGLTGEFAVEVAQISAVYGPGPVARLALSA